MRACVPAWACLVAPALLGAAACERVRELPLVAPAARAQHVAQPSISQGPWLLDSGTQLVVAWTTDASARGRVWFGAREPDHLAQEEEARVDHRVTLPRLSPATRYRYRVEGREPAEGSFTTAPAAEANQPFRVLIYGDNRTNSGDHALVVRAAAAEDAQLALHTGDMVVAAGDASLWKNWFLEERELLARTPIFATVGNHEMTDNGVAYSRYFQEPSLPPYRALDYGPLHIVALDSFEAVPGAGPHSGAISEAQKAWFEEDLRSVPKDRHVWVLVHQGPYAHPARARAGHGGSDLVKAVIVAGTRIHAIEAVFAGHEHFYERGEVDGLQYFVVGGGGAPLEDPDATFPGVRSALRSLSFAVVEVCGCHATGQAKDIAGHVLDSFTLATCAVPCGNAPALSAGAPQAPRPASADGAALLPAADAGAVEPPGADAGVRRRGNRRRRRHVDEDADGGVADGGTAARDDAAKAEEVAAPR